MPKTVLLADDSVTIQKVVGISFASEDVTLVTVDNGDDAIAKAREVRPDVILADVVMPGKNGYEVCEAVKADPALRHIPVLLLTGTFEAFDEERARAAGAAAHVAKPFESQTLIEQVNRLLAESASAPAPAAAPASPPREAQAEAAFDFFDDDIAELGAPETIAPDDSASLEPLELDDSPDASFAFGDDAAAAGVEVQAERAGPLAPAEQTPSRPSELTVAILDDEPLHAEPREPLRSGWEARPQRGAAERSAQAGPQTAQRGAAGPRADQLATQLEDAEAGNFLSAEPAGESFTAADPGVTPADEMFDFDFERPATSSSESILRVEADDLAQATVLDPDGAAGEFDVSASDIGDPLATELVPEPAPARDRVPEAAEAPRTERADSRAQAEALAAQIAPAVREQLHATLEKVAWDALGNLSEEIVQKAVERVERVAWEVIPQMAETLVREEIRRMKGADD